MQLHLHYTILLQWSIQIQQNLESTDNETDIHLKI